jgi:CRISPR-associated protein Csx17
MTNTLALLGCTPEPLIYYLKALGVLRLVAMQKDPDVRGCWEGNTFYITTILSQDELLDFFMEEYIPSPITAPWNGGSGYYGGSAALTIEQIEASKTERFASYRKTITGCREVIRQVGLRDAAPDSTAKLIMLANCRSYLPEEAVEIMDSLFVMTGDSKDGSTNWQRKFAPIFGTGGNDGRLEFTYTFIKHLLSVIPTTNASGKSIQHNLARLQKTLFGTGSPVLEKDSVGQYHPGGIGGPNSARGDRDMSLVNPWDYILAFEGAILFAGAATRRFSGERTSLEASFPFSVEATAAGWSTLPSSETDDNQRNRGEFWLPLWGNPATFQEVRYVFSEGRAQIGRRTARSGLDFARAVGSLGVDRGIQSFQRIGLLAGDRNGRAYLAVSLGRFPVHHQPAVNLFNELDNWLGRFRSMCNDKGTPARYRGKLRAVEEAMFAFCRYGGARRLQDVLIALGNAEQAIALMAMTTSKDNFSIQPLTLSQNWIQWADDNSPEFRITVALAGIAGDSEGKVGGIRENCEPVVRDIKKNRFVWQDNNFHVPLTDFPRSLNSILRLRMLAANKHNLEFLPLASKVPASTADVNQYLITQLDEPRMLGLLKGLTLINYRYYPGKINSISIVPSAFHPVYALLKLLFLPNKFSWPKGSQPITIRPELSILSRLAGRDISGATKVALRRLVSSGLVPKLSSTGVDSLVTSAETSKRIAGALLIPVYDWRRLADFTLVKPQEN